MARTVSSRRHVVRRKLKPNFIATPDGVIVINNSNCIKNYKEGIKKNEKYLSEIKPVEDFYFNIMGRCLDTSCKLFKISDFNRLFSNPCYHPLSTSKSKFRFHKHTQLGIMKHSNYTSLVMSPSKYLNTDRVVYPDGLRGFENQTNQFTVVNEDIHPDWDLRYSGMINDSANCGNRHLFNANPDDKFLLLINIGDDVLHIGGFYRLVRYDFDDLFSPSPWIFYFKKL